MTGTEIIEKLEEIYPASYAAHWDNPGLQVGRREKEIKKVFVALDATDEVIEAAVDKKADMLITHHPMLMSGMKKINTDDFMGQKIIRLIQNDISCFSMHTNYDVLMMAGLSAEYLELQDPAVMEVTYRGYEGNAVREEGFGRVGRLKKEMTLREAGELVKQAFSLDTVKIFGDLDKIVSLAAISPGSGKSMITPALSSGAQVLITGDIGHHEGLDAVSQGLSIIDAGHYGLEHIFIKQMAEYLKQIFPQLEVEQEFVKNPFYVLF